MSRFKFDKNKSAVIGNVRVSDDTHKRLTAIAELEGVAINEVVRVFIDASLEQYDEEAKDHFITGSKMVSKEEL